MRTLGDVGGESRSTAFTGPVGQWGICLFGIGDTAWAEAGVVLVVLELVLIPSSERGGVIGLVMVVEVLCGARGRVKAIVAMLRCWEDAGG